MKASMWLVLLVVVALPACRGSGGGGGRSAANPCETKSRCPSEPARSELDVYGCSRLLEHRVCGTLVRTHTECMYGREVCKDDGTTDWAATTRACQAETDAMQACLAAPPPAP
jgi:hypothetical protein